MLNTRDIGDKLRSDLQKVYSEAERARKIIHNLLTFARRRISRRRPLDLNYVLTKALEFRSYELRSNNIEVVCQFQVPLQKVLADRYQLQQVFFNFIVNAQQAMAAMGGGKLTISTKQRGDYVCVGVSDTGPGIPKEHLTRIFDPFYTTKPVGQGTGLGLSIAYGIVTDFGGKVKIDSTENKGATVVVELPVADLDEGEGTTDAALEGELDSRDVVEPLEVPVEPSETPAIPGAVKVLALDDEPCIVELISEILAQDGHQVDVAYNGQEGLEKISNTDYDLVICDLKMPMLSGQELFKFLQENKPELAGRVVFITGDVANPSTRAFLRKSKAYVLEKPFRPGTLMRVIAKALHER